jgi:hypothetical protein
LISAVVVARDAAVANEPVLPHLSSSMVEARAALEPLHAKWAANQSRAAAGTAPPVAGGLQRGSTSQVPDDVLHRQAVSVMQTLSSRLLEGYRAVQIPPLYQPSSISPYVPDPAPSSSPGRSSPGRSSDGGAGGGQATFLPGATPSPGASPAGSPGNLSLAGAPGVIPPPVPPGIGGSPPAFGAPGVSPVVGPVIGPVTPEVGGGGWSSGRSSPGGGSQWIRPGVRGLPPGGVINGPPEGTIEPVRPAGGGSRVNPAGGVIGPTTGRESEGMFAPPVGGAGRSGQRQVRSNPAYYSDEHWPQPKGVPSVLGATEPEPEPVHDPGMPVIGMDTPPQDRRERRDR